MKKELAHQLPMRRVIRVCCKHRQIQRERKEGWVRRGGPCQTSGREPHPQATPTPSRGLTAALAGSDLTLQGAQRRRLLGSWNDSPARSAQAGHVRALRGRLPQFGVGRPGDSAAIPCESQALLPYTPRRLPSPPISLSLLHSPFVLSRSW